MILSLEILKKINFIILADAPDETKCPKGFYLSISDDTKCLLFVTDGKDWSSAQDDCHSKGANLVTIDTEAKQTEIKSVVWVGQIWLGLRTNNDREFYWDSGVESVRYTIFINNFWSLIYMFHIFYITNYTGGQTFLKKTYTI